MPQSTLPPAQWVAAANMVVRRGQQIKIARVTVEAYTLELPDGTALAYRNDAQPRAFRSADQAQATLQTFNLTGPPITGAGNS